MPYDLWFRSTAAPPAFEPERLPIPQLPTRHMAESAAGSIMFFAAGTAKPPFEMVVVRVDFDGTPQADDEATTGDGS